MSKKYALARAIQELKSFIESKIYLFNSKTTEVAFTRLRKMSFCDIVYFMISSKRKCVQHELNEYFKQKGGVSVSRQAFAKSRKNIKPEAIRELNEHIVLDFEKNETEIAMLKGYRVLAVDGSVIDLPDNTETRERFGYSSCGTSTTICKGRAMLAQDVLNGITIYGELGSFFKSERESMHEISDYIKARPAYENTVFVLDRGYPSLELFLHLEKNNQKFLTRVSSSFYAGIQAFTEPDGFVNIKNKKGSYTVRVLNIRLTSGINEKLVTNLSPDEFTCEEVYSLYGMRWGIETNYGYLKNAELIECFTGESVIDILQDFYSGILILTLSAIAYREQEDVISAQKNSTKYSYKPNRKQIICDIKCNLVKMMTSKTKSQLIIRELYTFNRIRRFAYADVPGRSKPRNDPKRHSTRKTHPKSPM